MVGKTFNVHRHFTSKKQLLLIELICHLLLKRLLKKLTENDDERQYNEENENEPRGGEDFLLPEIADKTLKHRVIYS